MTYEPRTLLDVRAYLMPRTGLPAVGLGIAGDRAHKDVGTSYHLGEDELRAKIVANVTRAENGCWLWQRYVRPDGYGQVVVGGGRVTYVHRVAYQVWKGAIPTDYQVDHLCRVRSCCNPDHLEAVTPRVNVLRSTNFAARHARVEKCPAGHPYDESNTYLRPNGRGRDCRECRRQAMARSDARRRVHGHVPPDQRPAPRGGKTHCVAGHPYEGANVYVDPRGNKQCRTCRRAATARRQKRLREAVA